MFTLPSSLSHSSFPEHSLRFLRRPLPPPRPRPRLLTHSMKYLTKFQQSRNCHCHLYLDSGITIFFHYFVFVSLVSVCWCTEQNINENVIPVVCLSHNPCHLYVQVQKSHKHSPKSCPEKHVKAAICLLNACFVYHVTGSQNSAVIVQLRVEYRDTAPICLAEKLNFFFGGWRLIFLKFIL